ncbi:MAG: hypothetical protein AAF539_02180 [Planctomycetota bacterium]
MNSDRIQQFIVGHAEKAVVGIVFAASGWMIYSGLQMESILKQHQPDRLESDARQVRMSIDDDHNESVLDGRVPTFDIVKETLSKQRPVDPSPYQLPNLLERRTIDSSIRREDPILAAPAKLHVHGEIAMIALLSSSGNYPLQDLEGAEALEVVEKKPKPKPKSRRSRGGMDGSMDEEMMMMMEEQMMMDMNMGMDPSMMGSMMTGSGRSFKSDGDFGIRPMGKDGRLPVPRPGWFIAGTAVVPHADIAASFKAALSNAEAYLPLRDQPMYYNYEVQRADVTTKAIGDLADADWVLVRTREKDLIRAATQWAGFAPELVPKDYRDANLTGYIPPILLKDYSAFSLHPDVPMVGRDEQERKAAMDQMKRSDDISPDDLELKAPGVRGGLGMDMYGGNEGMGMGMGMGMYGGMTQIEEDPVEYKIMRFFDFASARDPNSPRPGRQYVYRIRYGIVDPNFPANPLQQPKISTLSRNVYDRVQELMVAAEATGKRDFQRWSDWSEPSTAVSLPALNEYYAGPVEQPRSRQIRVGDKEVLLSRDEPKGKIVNHALNMKYVATMPIWMEDVMAGTTLSHQGEAEAIDPIELAIKKVPDATILSQSTVIGLDGGIPLGLKDANEMELFSPGVMLMYDESGNLTVAGEVQDQEPYRIYSFSSERGL